MVIRPGHIVVTSNYKIDECGWMEQDLGPIKRRFQQCNAKQFRIIHEEMRNEAAMATMIDTVMSE